MHTLRKQLSILVGSILRSLSTSSLQGKAVSFVLDSLRRDESLDLRGFGVWLRAFFLRLDFTTDDELAVLKCE